MIISKEQWACFINYCYCARNVKAIYINNVSASPSNLPLWMPKATKDSILVCLSELQHIAERVNVMSEMNLHLHYLNLPLYPFPVLLFFLLIYTFWYLFSNFILYSFFFFFIFFFFFFFSSFFSFFSFFLFFLSFFFFSFFLFSFFFFFFLLFFLLSFYSFFIFFIFTFTFFLHHQLSYN